MSSSATGGRTIAEPEFVEGELEARAWRFAAGAHEGQRRKGDGSPYINHPVAVAELTERQGGDSEQVAAAFLHDVLEDTDTPAERIHERFGAEVGRLVEALSDDRSIGDYERRKAGLRSQVEAAGERAILIYGADKLANAGDLRRIYRSEGEAVEDRFNAPLELRIRLWREDLEMAVGRIGRTSLLAELEAELDALERDRAAKAA